MSGLHSALDELDAEDLSSVSDEGLQADVVELTRAADRIAAQRLRRLAEIDRRRSYRHEGHLSTAAWMIDRLRMNSSQAAQQVEMASALEAMPRTRRRWPQGSCRVMPPESWRRPVTRTLRSSSKPRPPWYRRPRPSQPES